MAHPDDFNFYLSQGCEVMDHSLGIQQMPTGYHLLLDADGMYFFWMERATGRESAICLDKWVVYRDAKSDAAKRLNKQADRLNAEAKEGKE